MASAGAATGPPCRRVLSSTSLVRVDASRLRAPPRRFVADFALLTDETEIFSLIPQKAMRIFPILGHLLLQMPPLSPAAQHFLCNKSAPAQPTCH